VCVETGAPDEPDELVPECPGLGRVTTGRAAELPGAEAAWPGLGRVVTGCADAVGWPGLVCPGLGRVATGAAGCPVTVPVWFPLARVVPP
jgi:hypothetical protein